MILIDGVDARGVSPRLWMYLLIIADLHEHATGEELFVTSMRRPPGARPSRHSPAYGRPVAAADLRRWYLDNHKVAETFARQLQLEFNGELGVVLEPEWLTADQIAERGGVGQIAPHLHVELHEKVSPWL